jgi:hypothetical protein
MTLLELMTMAGKYVLLPFVGGLIGVAIKGWLEDRRFSKLKSARNICGRWKGELSYTKPRWPRETVEIEFYSARFLKLPYSRLIKGVIRLNNNPIEELLVRGGFYEADQLLLDYKS